MIVCGWDCAAPPIVRAGDRVVENQALLRDHWEGEGELRSASLSIFLFLYLNVIAGFVFGAQLISTLRQKSRTWTRTVFLLQRGV